VFATFHTGQINAGMVAVWMKQLCQVFAAKIKLGATCSREKD